MAAKVKFGLKNCYYADEGGRTHTRTSILANKIERVGEDEE